jgi:hypothetical protein
MACTVGIFHVRGKPEMMEPSRATCVIEPTGEHATQPHPERQQLESPQSEEPWQHACVPSLCRLRSSVKSQVGGQPWSQLANHKHVWRSEGLVFALAPSGIWF